MSVVGTGLEDDLLFTGLSLTTITHEADGGDSHVVFRVFVESVGWVIRWSEVSGYGGVIPLVPGIFSMVDHGTTVFHKASLQFSPGLSDVDLVTSSARDGIDESLRVARKP